MRMDKLTNKFQMALADAQSLAVGRDHQFIEPVHLMVALLDQQGGTVRHFLACFYGATSKGPGHCPATWNHRDQIASSL